MSWNSGMGQEGSIENRDLSMIIIQQTLKQIYKWNLLLSEWDAFETWSVEESILAVAVDGGSCSERRGRSSMMDPERIVKLAVIFPQAVRNVYMGWERKTYLSFLLIRKNP